jgi:signal transduction histidine kinase
MSVKSQDLRYRYWKLFLRWRLWAQTRFVRLRQLSSLFERTSSTKQKEQKRIARHLHDTLGHDLAFLCLKLEQLSNEQQLKVDSETLLSEFESMRVVANKAYEQVRRLLNDLRGETYVSYSTDWVSYLKDCALLIGERARFAVNVEIEGRPCILPPQIQQEIFYLVREILQNIEKHAHAENVILTFICTDTGISIKVSDDGQGFDVSAKQNMYGHYGFKIIREIVGELHGTLTVESDSTNGTQILFWLPIYSRSY